MAQQDQKRRAWTQAACLKAAELCAKQQSLTCKPSNATRCSDRWPFASWEGQTSPTGRGPLFRDQPQRVARWAVAWQLGRAQVAGMGGFVWCRLRCMRSQTVPQTLSLCAPKPIGSTRTLVKTALRAARKLVTQSLDGILCARSRRAEESTCPAPQRCRCC